MYASNMSRISFVDHLCYFCLVLLCFYASLFVSALWSPAGKGLTSWLSFVMSNCDVDTFPLVFLGQMLCLIVLIPDLCPLSYFVRYKYQILVHWLNYCKFGNFCENYTFANMLKYIFVTLKIRD